MLLEEIKRMLIFVVIARMLLYIVARKNYERYGRFIVGLALVYMVIGLVRERIFGKSIENDAWQTIYTVNEEISWIQESTDEMGTEKVIEALAFEAIKENANEEDLEATDFKIEDDLWCDYTERENIKIERITVE